MSILDNLTKINSFSKNTINSNNHNDNNNNKINFVGNQLQYGINNVASPVYSIVPR